MDLGHLGLSRATSLTPEDILFVLKAHHLIDIHYEGPSNPPAPRQARTISRQIDRSHLGLHGLLSDMEKENEALKIPYDYSIDWDPAVIGRYLDEIEKKRWVLVRPAHLRWTPFLPEKRRLKRKVKKVVEFEQRKVVVVEHRVEPPTGLPELSTTMTSEVVRDMEGVSLGDAAEPNGQDGLLADDTQPSELTHRMDIDDVFLPTLASHSLAQPPVPPDLPGPMLDGELGQALPEEMRHDVPPI